MAVKQCVVCGGNFIKFGSAKVCPLPVCKLELHRRQPSWKRKSDALRRKRQSARVFRKCLRCGNMLGINRSKYCGVECARDVQRHQIIEHCRKRVRVRKAKLHARVCVICSAPFSFDTRINGCGVPKTCSPLCSGALKKRSASQYAKRPEVKAVRRLATSDYKARIADMISALRKEAPHILKEFEL